MRCSICGEEISTGESTSTIAGKIAHSDCILDMLLYRANNLESNSDKATIEDASEYNSTNVHHTIKYTETGYKDEVTTRKFYSTGNEASNESQFPALTKCKETPLDEDARKRAKKPRYRR